MCAVMLICFEVSHKETDSTSLNSATSIPEIHYPLSITVYTECRLIKLEESFSRFDVIFLSLMF